MTKWLDEPSLDEDVVVSTRVRIARNLDKYKFPSLLSINESDELTDEVLVKMKEVLDSNYQFFRTRDLSDREQLVYVEKHLISPGLIQEKNKSSFLLRNDEKASIMINEEDHIRVQTLFPGSNLEKAWELCSNIDDRLEENLKYAYDKDLGYLTSCPTNVGTGLRASVMLHLPCITMTNNMNSLIEGLGSIGITVRGLYGEGSKALGNLYQISNQTTLGQSEEEIIEKLNKVVQQIINKERNTRKHLKEYKLLELEDKVYRSSGILRYARILTSKEATVHLSNIRLGLEMEILETGDFKDVIKLMMDIQPANIQIRYDKDMNEQERDTARANVIREYISNMEG
ncbi:MAG TPA: protein arginine kinase [Tissierellaceae bacterium]|nr:protein arginine kinase [Tissierellaceae bacterium]